MWLGHFGPGLAFQQAGSEFQNAFQGVFGGEGALESCLQGGFPAGDLLRRWLPTSPVATAAPHQITADARALAAAVPV